MLETNLFGITNQQHSMKDSTRVFDWIIGEEQISVVVGGTALQRAGLTTCISEDIQMSTLCPEINGCGAWITSYYFSPWADKYFETHPSPVNPNLLEPSEERAIVETILLMPNFDEGVLIESIKNYIFDHHDDLTRLYEVCDMFGSVFRKNLDYWITEARNDYDD